VYSCSSSERKELLSSLSGREVVQALDDPALIVAFAKFRQRNSQFFDILNTLAHSNISFSVRMNRSTHPLHSAGARTMAKIPYPERRFPPGIRHSCAGLPWSCWLRMPAAAPARKPPH
jgi:hypothetical protein